MVSSSDGSVALFGFDSTFVSPSVARAHVPFSLRTSALLRHDMTRKPEKSSNKSARRGRHQYTIWFSSLEQDELKARAERHDETISAHIRRALGFPVPRPGPAPAADKQTSHIRRLHKK
jgi:hypothetical protein